MKKPPERSRKHLFRLELTLAAALALLILGWLSWDAYYDYRWAEEQLPTIGRMEILRAEIVHLDEVLTMSARMAAASGNLDWETRYRRFEQQLDQSIQEAARLDPNASLGAAAAKTDAANVALVAMEHRAFELVRQGNNAEAQRLLSSGEYEAHKKVYAAGMTEFNDHLVQASDSVRAELLEDMLRTVITTIASAVLLILGAWLVFRATRRWQAVIVESNQQLIQKTAELGELNDQLDRKVSERTRELVQAGERLQASEAQYRLLFDSNPHPMWVYDVETLRFVTVNGAAVEHYGYSEQQFLAMTIRDIRPVEDVVTLENNVDELQGQDKSFGVWCHRKRDGSLIDVEISSDRIVFNGRPARLVLAHDMTERKRADQLLRLEHMVASSLANADSGSTALQAVIRAICEAQGWECGRYLQVDEQAGVLRFRESWHVPDDAIEQFVKDKREAVFGPGVGLAGRVWQSGQPTWVADIKDDAHALQSAVTLDISMHGAFHFPVMSNGKTIGVLAFNSRNVREPDDRLLPSVNMIGSQIGQFMMRMAQQERIARLNRIHAVLSGINTLIVRVHERQELFNEACRIAVEHGNFGMAWIGMVDPATQEVTPVAWAGENAEEVIRDKSSAPDDTPGERSVGRAMRERRPVFNNDIIAHSFGGPRWKEILRLGLRSEITLPLFEDQTVVGTLTMFAREPNFFDAEELRLLTQLAGDISFALEHIAKEERLEYLAYYDSLTGLPNRTLFLDRMNQQLHARSSEPRMVALILLDLERFRMVNETMGRHGGDELLRQVAKRLEDACQGKQHIARVSGNGYGVVMRGARDAADIAHAVESQLLTCFREPYTVNGTELRMAVKAGIALFPADGSDTDTLFRNAEAALKKAKSSGDRYLFYAAKMNERAAEALSLETRLRKAVEVQQFVLHYQPKIELASGRICGVEALIRWNDPENGLIPPVHFIPLLEETGLIIEVGQWALEQALADYRDWVARGYDAPRIAVNVSPIQLRQKDFVDMISKVIGDMKTMPQGLDIEITESLLMEDIQGNIVKLKALRDMGINIAIDDFGTGYSSLGYLARLPVNALKIDRSFIIAMGNDADSMAIVSTIISLGHSLNMKVIAEGVETEEQSRFLKLLKCDQMQGYLFSKPVPSEILETKFLAPPPGG